MLEYFLSGDKVLIWVVQAPLEALGAASSTAVHLRCKSVTAEEVRKMVVALRSAIEAPPDRTISEKAATVSRLLRSLYDALIAADCV
ncbi:MAG: hypothetical protein ACLP4V_33950 [Methylocella sp.]